MGKAKSYTKKQMLGKALMYIVLILGAIYTLIPFATIIITSFRTTKDSARGPFTWPHEWQIVENYISAWEMGHFDRYLLNSIFMMVITVIGTLFVATLAGYSFAKFRYPGKNVLYYTLLLSMMIPFQTIMLPLYFILRASKLLNTLTGVAILGIATGLGFAIMMMRSFFISLPDSLLEAARLDGCSELGVLLRIVMPNTFPAWASLIVFVAMASWNNLLAPMIYIFNEEKYPIPYALYAFQSAHTTSYELLSAGMMISILPIILIYILFQKNFQANLMAGAVKG
ncbi:carbohydrate ABC transporter permease [Massiliimalia timonensis]|uniref:carbohydrate ABC transporter permease n=1 Tax=Massiliimalia timonensis TaxID=1987501 RepID=UPI00189DB001|nr:carbohydrate ABC transporter permease [Massiliimalia timonensis]